MALTAELRAFADRLAKLYRQVGVSDFRSLRRKLRSDPEFAQQWRDTWRDIARADGGKLSLATLGTILGASFGGVGIAAFGGAIGLPLAAILGLGGFLSGTQVDASRSRGGLKPLGLLLSPDLEARLDEAARAAGQSKEALAVSLLSASLGDEERLLTDD